MMRRKLMLVIALGLATLRSSIAWSEDSDQAALIKALNGAKLTLLQGIAQVAKCVSIKITEHDALAAEAGSTQIPSSFASICALLS